MEVGVNYPWYDYGWDFGEAPPEWRRSDEPNWACALKKDLERLRGLGVKVVRWFILADGLTYGSGPHAPGGAGGADFTPVQLPPKFVDHFTVLLDAFRRERLQVLPVFVDHTFFLPGREADPEG